MFFIHLLAILIGIPLYLVIADNLDITEHYCGFLKYAFFLQFGFC